MLFNYFAKLVILGLEFSLAISSYNFILYSFIENFILSSIGGFIIWVAIVSSVILWNLAKYLCSKAYSALGLFKFIYNNY